MHAQPFEFKFKIFSQTGGTPLQLASQWPLANSIYPNWFEEKFIYSKRCKNKRTLRKEMRDGVFIIWDHGEEKLWELLSHVQEAGSVHDREGEGVERGAG